MGPYSSDILLYAMWEMAPMESKFPIIGSGMGPESNFFFFLKVI